MNEQPPDPSETAKERFERISKMPGVIVHHNPDPNPTPFVSDIRVNEGVTVADILGRDEDDEEEVPTMNEGPPAWVKDAKSRLEWVSRVPGVVVHHNLDPKPWTPPTDIRVINITDINELTGDDWENEDEVADEP